MTGPASQTAPIVGAPPPQITPIADPTAGLAADRSASSAVDLALGLPELSPAEPPRGRKAWWSSVVVADVVGLALAFALGALARQPLGSTEGPGVAASLLRELPYIPVFMLTMALYGLYQSDRRRMRPGSFIEMGPRGHALGVGAGLTVAISSGLHKIFGGVSKIGWVEVIFMVVPAAVIGPMARSALKSLGRDKLAPRTRVVILGSGTVAASLARRLSSFNDVQLVGIVDDEPYRGTAAVLPRYLGPLSELPDICARNQADRVLVAFSQISPRGIAEALRRLPPNVRVSVVPRLFELVTWQSQIEELHGLTLLDIAPPCLGSVSRAIKRTMDIVVSIATLLALSPLLIAIAIAIKTTSKGPVLFRQDRVGYKGRTFRICKFRTMAVGSDEIKIDLRDHNQVDGPLFKLHNDPRVTKVGKLLRTTSLDELPQLFNVVMGDMSLVGPRPFVPDESAGIDGWAKKRFDVRPGMTGLWQVSGRNDLPFDELRQLDYAYVASWSIWWDVKILWHTPGSVFRRHGAY